ncbi:methyltransferase [Halovenus salina]|uniref:Methyltransferase n=1 Tax=Halovenus salina TaxID=1510225 RepID=A0ABD5VVW5_9EURY|nr:methyltransferase [Halovenus salina]
MTLTLEAQVPETPDAYHFRTADGLHAADEFRDADLLLLETLWEHSLDDLLVVQGNYGVVPTVLDATADTVTMTETSSRAARLARTNIDRNGASADVSLSPTVAEVERSFDAACYAPKPYTPLDVGKRRLVDTLSVLRKGGRLYVAGEPSAGISRYENCLREHASHVEVVNQTGRCRVVAATRSGDIGKTAFCPRQTITAHVDGVDLSMVTEPGLFSPNSLDDGTRLLLETAVLEDGEKVLDLACGYGPVGAYSAATADVDVLLTDDNARATACAAATLDATGVEGRVRTVDCLCGLHHPVDRVLCNPPTHAGSGVLSDLFGGVKRVLGAGGELSVVHHRSLDLDEYLERVGTIVDRTAGTEHTVVTVRST